MRELKQLTDLVWKTITKVVEDGDVFVLISDDEYLILRSMWDEDYHYIAIEYQGYLDDRTKVDIGIMSQAQIDMKQNIYRLQDSIRVLKNEIDKLEKLETQYPTMDLTPAKREINLQLEPLEQELLFLVPITWQSET